MKQYIGVEAVEAEEMSFGDYCEKTGYPSSEEFDDKTEGYYVETETGHHCFKTKEVFEMFNNQCFPDYFSFPLNMEKEYTEMQYKTVLEFNQVYNNTIAYAKMMSVDEFDNIPEDDQILMDKQLKAMIMYRDCLYKRIQRF